METNSLRAGQVEIHLVSPEKPGYVDRVGGGYCTYLHLFPHHYLIKTFYQTDEEAGGCEENRKAMLIELEGKEYIHNGVVGVYKNVGKCQGAPREYAVQTVLIRSAEDIVVYEGDYDYSNIVGMWR